MRGRVTADAVGAYLDRYFPLDPELPVLQESTDPEPADRIFSIWFQGEAAAPPLVQACWRSIRKNCPQELVVLDAESVFDWVRLPENVVCKWREGKIRHAHFADICRLDLLYRHGGIWMDATDFAAHPLPSYVLDSPFFVYMSGNKLTGFYSFVQNCFIRARRGDYLAGRWLQAVLRYWASEDSAVDYFVHQLLFKKVVEHDEIAAGRFALMPSMEQDPTHVLWFSHGADAYDPALFEQWTGAAAFQKCEFKSAMAQNPPEGSFAEAVVRYGL